MTLQRLRELRKSKGISQTFMAKKLGYKYASGYANIEMGRTKPSLEVAKKISVILEEDFNDIFFGNELHRMSNNE